jgi:hypothetical protein
VKLVFPSHEFDEAVAAVCHGTASDEQMRLLNELLRRDPTARDEYLVRVELHARLASESDLFASVASESPDLGSGAIRGEFFTQGRQTTTRDPVLGSQARWMLALAACLALLLGGGWWARYRLLDDRPGATSRAVAMLNRVVNAQWTAADPQPHLGASLEPGTLRLESGLAQIVFYNGARVVLEGPAEFQLVSSSKALCRGGKLTAEVPPQARGFQIVAPRMDVTDLGTAFGLNVTGARTELHVFRGNVEFRTEPKAAAQNLKEGKGAVVEGAGEAQIVAADPRGFASLFDLQAKSVAAEAQRYDRWREANERLRHDPSLWIHFDFEHGSPSDWRLPNVGSRSATVPDATIVGCQWQEGRWSTKPALEFRSVSDRIRLSLPGTFESVTLATWVRVQGLDRKITSLFMSDGFESGTIHWVIRNDGVLGLTVIGPKADHQILTSPPVINSDQFGDWMHLAVVIDGHSKRVTHYVNGRGVSSHALRFAPPFQVGTAELGNWNPIGFPGNDPFLIRNFSGVMDEFSLYGRPLDASEIQNLYTGGRPQTDVPTVR